MSAEIKSFADKSGSCFSWTEVQMLEALLTEIREGKLVPQGMVIVFAVLDPKIDNAVKVRSWRSQLDWANEYVYLDIAKAQALEGRRY